MSNKIKILPENIANKIAAGEVVQRPASVVKELLENSLDAGAKNIDVYIKRAGKSLIQVADDGEGMSSEDALLSIRRHATSKIKSVEDLNSIKSYGFRGEALSSIAAVSVLEIKTERMQDEIGALIKVNEDGTITAEKGSFSKGSSVAVKNLFFNTPGRRNFLKSNATELKHIINVFKRIALTNPEVHFRFFNEEELLFDYKAGSLNDRMKQVFAENILDALVEINEPTDFISIKGFLAKPSYMLKSKGDQYVFVNSRFVLSRLINHAVFSAYENLLEKGEYPFFILFIDIEPSSIDVNVHPAKMEIKFEDENAIYSLINSVVKKAISSYDLVPSMNFDDRIETGEKLRFNKFAGNKKEDFSDRPVFKRRDFTQYSPVPLDDKEIDLLFNSINKEMKEVEEGELVTPPFSPGAREVFHSVSGINSSEPEEASFIVSLHNKYILSQIKSGLMIIDQHVAHERILYEKALRALNSDLPFSQQLLFPQAVEVQPEDFEILKELEEYLTRLGFRIEFVGNYSIKILGVPSDIKAGHELKILNEILHDYKENEREKELDIKHKVAASYSCKAAVKAGDKLTEQEMRILVDQLFATSMPYVCPHGRPIVIKIPLTEFDRRFGRT